MSIDLQDSTTTPLTLTPTGTRSTQETSSLRVTNQNRDIEESISTTKQARRKGEELLIKQGITLVPTSQSQLAEPTKSNWNNSIKAFQKAQEVGKLHSKISSLLTDLRNPAISDQALFNKLINIAPPELMDEIKKNLHLSVGPSSENALEANPRILLQLRDENCNLILDSYLSHLSKRLISLRDKGHLYSLQHILLLAQSSDQKPVTKGLQKDAWKEFNQLSPECQNKIIEIIQKKIHSGLTPDQIRKMIEISPELLLIQISDLSVIEHRLQKVSGKVKTPFHFPVAYMLADKIQQGDSQETAWDVMKVHQLQELYFLLNSPVSPERNKLIFEKFNGLDYELKAALGKALWIACYRPEVLFFTEEVLKKTPQMLLDCKDKNGNDILMQLMAHYKSKVLLRRLVPQLQSMQADFNGLQDTQSRLKVFHQLPEFVQSDLSNLVWLEHGGRNNPEFGWWRYGEQTIEKNPLVLTQGQPSIIEQYLKALDGRLDYHILMGVEKFESELPVPQAPVDCSASRQLSDPRLSEELPKNMQVAMVAAEFAGVINMGGLAPAVEGMARAYGVDKTRIILPKYDVINSALVLKEKAKYQIEVNGKTYKVFKAKVNGFKCYFIEDELFNVGRNAEGKPNNIYNGQSSQNPDAEVKRRWAHFQSEAAELVMKFSQKEKNPVELVHVHDAQTALVPKILQERHFEEWKKGLTPATVFTFHNNNCPLPYDYQETQESLREIGLSGDPLNSFIEGVEKSDMSTTVSEKFAEEVQTDLYGKGMQRPVRINASKGNVVGIVNGNTNGWNPKTDAQLKKWIDPVTGNPIDLTYGPDDADLAEKTIAIREQLVKYLNYHDLGKIDPKKPIFFYVGRYDAYQKGIDKLPLIMKEAVKNGAQFICIGLEPDEKADAALKEMETYAKEIDHQGVCIIRDFKRKDGRIHWQQGNSCPEDKTGVQGFGNLLRAAVDVGIFPSIFEPCGLVQGEMHRMGVETAATATGGFVNTIITSGPNQNGYLFPRIPDWQSEQQDIEIQKTVQEAAERNQEKLDALYGDDPEARDQSVAQKRVIMRNAANSSWDKTFDGSLSPIDRMKRVYAKSLRNRSLRGVIPMDVHPLSLV
ncbi:MAG: glycogen/starch synthase [Verrucomicrobia bacterium]|nr:glycogen/starch synthase [Verrucomicrobiota bacterium]